MLPEEHRIALMSIASELQERQENA
jgi:hypothetical protein